MELKAYFDQHKGAGVLATADSSGKVNAAVYARPHVMEDGSLAIIMRDRLTHANIQSNPHAAFLFIEEGGGYRGKRLYLTKIREEENSELLAALRRKSFPKDSDEMKFLVFFQIDRELPLIGSGG